METKNTQVLILSAGRIPEELECVFGDIPSGLIPLNGRPVLFWTIDKLLHEGFSKIAITVGFRKEKIIKVVKKHYNPRPYFNFIEVDFTRPPGNAIVESAEHLDGKHLLVILGDTLIEEKFSELIKCGNSFVSTSKHFMESKKWCLVREKNDYISRIYDKKEKIDNRSDLYALVGVYFFDDLNLFKKLVKNLNHRNLEISEIIKKYKRYKPIRSILCEEWYDLGHIENYYLAKKRLLKTRFFNYLEFDNLLGTLTKKSKNNARFINEIEWYLKLPKELSILSPRVIDYSISADPFIKMDYIGYPTLAELWLYGDIHIKMWKNILNRLLAIVNLFKKYRGKVSWEDYKYIYITKTDERIQELTNSNKIFDELFQNDSVTINEIKYKNWFSIKDEVYRRVKELYVTEDNCLIHGDLCFSNIFYDINNGIFKFIDPRGKWGSSNYGDIKYDIAKLRHSVSGNYDFITNKLYSISVLSNKIHLNVFQEKIHNEIGNYFDDLITRCWDLNQIKLIEGLLFISMLPLHGDDIKRQHALYSIGIKQLNEIIHQERV